MIYLHPVIIFLSIVSFVNSEFVVDTCDMMNYYMENSTYQANLNLLQSSLLSSIIPSGFSNYTIGEYPDQVFGLALCRGDVSAEICQSCLKSSIEGGDGASTRCPYGKAEMIWFDECFLRYSDTSFFSTPGHVSHHFCNLNDIKYPRQFNAILHKLMNTLATQAANNSEMFAAGFMNYAKSTKLYGLAQCTRDLSKNDCYQCLREFVNAIPRYCYGKFGGNLLGTSCNIRYESYLFYDDLAVSNAAATVTADTTEGNSGGKSIL
ncbi:cysteine-rich RECEPTOR-like kinase [Rhynchospora pubera]|uniref:Cysteine-rich RECEPTOR-like kinase n=1 Tax=Rhynchospora pubera TaxID=906938 RepID=A0AAV8BQC7_9POAL|nr:cysteine-rich RECEPTOR-like kinase [Rhynchospora pubera]